MQTTNMSEKGLETLIENSLLNEALYVKGNDKDYDKDHAVDCAKLLELSRNACATSLFTLRHFVFPFLLNPTCI